MRQPQKILSVFSLVMINVIAVDSLRTLPITAKLGLPLIAYYLVAAFAFFIPVALVAAELATAYPNTGGIYIWVREAFGRGAGFVTIWLQWIYNIVWYPTILAFITSTIAYLFDPSLANHKLYLLSTVLGTFWFFTLLNCFGMRVSRWVSIIGALFGTLIPMVGIAVLGITWIIVGNPSEIAYATPSAWIPDLSSLGNVSLFSAVLFGLLGIEMSAVHAEDVKNPQRDYPRALLYSGIIIFSTLILGSLAIITVIPTEKLSVVSGLINAFDIFFNAFHMPWMTKIIAACIILGGLSAVSTWIIGPTKGLMVAAQDGSLPAIFGRVNRYQAPIGILFLQGILFSLLSTVFLLENSVNAAYWMLSALCDALALSVYIFMFAAVIRLRYNNPLRPRAYKIPGGKVGVWVVGGMGLLCCLSTVLIGFVPPTQIPIEHVFFFEAFLLTGLVVFIGLPLLILRKNRR